MLARTLLLVDGTNVVMRCAFGGDVPPERAVPTALAMVLRATRELHATHVIVAFDGPGPTWRHVRYPAYKANRTRDTQPFVRVAIDRFTQHGFQCVQCEGHEADDVIATLARRAKASATVVVLSNDSDLTQLIDHTVCVVAPGHPFKPATTAKYGDSITPANMCDAKALVGDHSDNVPGVPGIGWMRANALLTRHGSLAQFFAGTVPDTSREAILVKAHQDAVLLALSLVTLNADAPVPEVAASACAVTRVRMWTSTGTDG